MLSPLLMEARHSPQFGLSTHSWRQKLHAAGLLSMQLTTICCKASMAAGSGEAVHCRAAPAPSPALSVVRHDTQSTEERHCCLRTEQVGKYVSQSFANVPSRSESASVAVHAGERSTSDLVTLPPSAMEEYNA